MWTPKLLTFSCSRVRGQEDSWWPAKAVFNSQGESICSSVPFTSLWLPLVQSHYLLISCPLPIFSIVSEYLALSKSCQLPSLLSMFYETTLPYCTFGKTYLICFSLSEKWNIEFFPVNPLLERVPWKWQLTISYNFTKSSITKPLVWMNSSRILFKVILENKTLISTWCLGF